MTGSWDQITKLEKRKAAAVEIDTCPKQVYCRPVCKDDYNNKRSDTRKYVTCHKEKVNRRVHVVYGPASEKRGDFGGKDLIAW